MAGTQMLKRSGAAVLPCTVHWINISLGFIKSPCAPKRLKDVVPDNVVVEGALSASEAEDSDLNMSPTKQPLGKHGRKKKRGKKSDG